MFPANVEFERDPGVTYARWRVYTHLRLNVLSFIETRPVKHWALVHALRMSPNVAIDTLDWLVAEGYLLEHPRAHTRAPRSFSLVYSRANYPHDSKSAA